MKLDRETNWLSSGAPNTLKPPEVWVSAHFLSESLKIPSLPQHFVHPEPHSVLR